MQVRSFDETALQLDQSLGDRYAIERQLGRGGMATVYLARDAKHRRPVAIKVIDAEVANYSAVPRFLAEIEIVARLQHPHILPLFDSGSVNGILFYVMPFVEGGSLRARLDREQQLPLADVFQIVRDIASALDYAHQQNVLHRDIKPENILLSRGSAVVADFGIGRAIMRAGDESHTSTGVSLGTPAYMSPEQAAGEQHLDGRSDQYALACVVYEMIAGMRPFTGPNAQAIIAQHMVEAPRSLVPLRPGLPPHIEASVFRAMSKAAADRYGTIEEFANALTHDVEVRLPHRSAVDSQGKSRPLSHHAASSHHGSNLGPVVSRMCDRWRQVNEFDASFRKSHHEAPSKVQAYILHGDEGEAHESFVQRLIATRIAEFASEIAGLDRGTVSSYKCPWPDTHDAETRQLDIALGLFREIAPTYIGNDVSAGALLRLRSESLNAITVVQHDINAARWDSVTDGLLEWYLASFWGAVETHGTLLLVFLNIIYPRASRWQGLAPWWKKRQLTKQDVHRRMVRVCERVKARCPIALLNELTPVTVDDVKDWFSQNRIYDSELRRHELANSVFKDASAKRMAEVELALHNIHQEFVRNAATIAESQL